MKSRMGFVSNSSSSSFIIQWQCNMIDKDFDDIEGVISSLMDECEPRAISEIAKTTQKMNKSPNRYITTFFTAIENSVEDFGELAAVFNLAFTIDGIRHGKLNFEKIHESIEDGGW